MVIEKYITLPLTYSPYHFIKGGGQNTFMVGGRPGKLMIFDNNATILHQLDLDENLKSIDFCHEMERIAVVNKKGISIINYQQEEILFLKDRKYKEIIYTQNYLWALKKINYHKAILEVYDATNWGLIDSIEIEDIFVNSGYLLVEGVSEQSVIIWMAAGQDGQCNFIVELNNNKLQFTEFIEYDTIPLFISPNS